ncbi:hypothetical protein FY528_10260 [Hymenobacter lutimineralis]|uniref:Uncharacterized protein n=1 Tax=Hymenobacter lutimineralis TaxID=2606448 RepID=A0A5D6V3D4_9BACT|nr:MULTISPECIES: hypothetical protein [Hymenobacter]QIX60979.1 hypothetical protein HER32_07200 [Hymenobacter sp. BT18]TYZ09615.1 hypothetical protein FY528_10260 [Hymenobacter lutimineralis]
MKKRFLAAALLLSATVSWAFYPKPAASTGYMMVTGVGRTAGLGSFNASLTVTSESGEQTTEALDSKMVSPKNVAEGFLALHQLELRKLNQLAAEGWSVIGVTQNNSYQGVINETTYLLRKL